MDAKLPASELNIGRLITAVLTQRSAIVLGLVVADHQMAHASVDAVSEITEKMACLVASAAEETTALAVLGNSSRLLAEAVDSAILSRVLLGVLVIKDEVPTSKSDKVLLPPRNAE